ncbi:unnamed protein product [Strongylus vulgaris]|uniref:Uncharacterized protein n=1 Tax=Strongylus vulgaris TaxID=40348 RepID=A0A3P7JIP9_STRVU|nr:unnamed protein product [Strongylus vulgaris]
MPIGSGFLTTMPSQRVLRTFWLSALKLCNYYNANIISIMLFDVVRID